MTNTSEVEAGSPGAVVRTVLGDIRPEDLGQTSAHEHIAVWGGMAAVRDPSFRLDDLERICADVAEFRSSGGSAVVDTMPIVEGRSAEKLAEISRRTGVHVVASTGFHLGVYYLDTHWLFALPPEELAELIVAEITVGMDEHCYSWPDRRPTGARAGVIKAAAGYHTVDDVARKQFAAAAIAHRVTGAPVIVHTSQGTAAHEVIDQLESGGVAPGSVQLSHLDRNPDLRLHLELASRGIFLGYDWVGRVKERPDSVLIDLILAMAGAGFGSRMVVGMDLVRRSYWPAFGGGPGLGYLFGTFVPRLVRAGLHPDDADAIARINPARWLAFSPRVP